MYYSIGKTIKSNSVVQNICMFLHKDTSRCRDNSALIPQWPKYYIFGIQFYSKKKVESSDSMFFSIFMLENIWYHNFTWRELNSLEIVIFVPIMDPWRLELSRNRMNNFLWIQSTLDKVMIYGIFRVKLVAKNSAWIP